MFLEFFLSIASQCNHLNSLYTFYPAPRCVFSPPAQFISLAFNHLYVFPLPPSQPLPRPHSWCWLLTDHLMYRPIDSVVVSALRNNQWLLGGASTSVALQGCHTVSANYRHHLLLPPVSNLPRRTDHSTAMDSATLPKNPFLLCPPSSNPKLCLSALSGLGYFCVCVFVCVCEVSAFVAEFIWIVGCQSCLDSLVIPRVPWYISR